MEEERILIGDAELRADAGADGKTRVSGLAVPYNRRSEDLGGFVEEILPGAFADTLAGKDEVSGDIEHDRGKKLARRSNRSLELHDAADGLRFTMVLPATQTGKDAAEEVRSGLLDGVSIVFRGAKADWTGKGTDMVRRVSKAVLRSISLTSIPAYRHTVGTLTMRSLEEARQAEEAAALEAERKAAAEAGPSIEMLRMRLDLADAENYV